MRVIAFGDVYGRIGRTALIANLQQIIKAYQADVLIVNVDNISSGRGAIPTHLLDLEKAGVDVMTSGDHVFDNKDTLIEYISSTKTRLIRPANFYEFSGMKIPGIGYKILEKKGKKVAVIHLMGQVFMRFEVYNPFLKLEELLLQKDIQDCDIRIVDFHKEATSEIQALSRYFDGRISFVFGTHTHVQTNDEQILAKGTGCISDLGMCGPQDSIIGADIESIKPRFYTGMGTKITQSLDKKYLVQGVFFEVSETGMTTQVEKIQIKGKL